MDCLYETVASAWIAGLRVVNRRAVEGDLESEACEELSGSLGYFTAERTRLEGSIAALAARVRELRATMPRAELRKTLVRSRALRVQLGTLERKIATLEQNMEKIEEGKSNRLMLSSLKTVNKALKKMGHQVGIGETDQVISDLEENLQTSTDITHTLSGTLSGDMSFDDEELEAELGEILADTAPAPIFTTAAAAAPATAAPAAANGMGAAVAMPPIPEHEAVAV
jgi:hypothetical protein